MPIERRDRPLAHDADADRRRRVVAAARGDRQAAREPELVGHVVAHRGRHLGPLVDLRQPLARDLERVEDLGRPVARAHVEQQRAGGVRGVGRALAGELEPHVVLRQQHARDARVRVRLVVAQPQDLRRLEAGERGIAGQLEQPLRADALGDLVALGRGALVVPQQRRADHRAARVEEHGPVHLAGEAEPDDLVGAGRGDLRQHRLRRLPPVGRLLLGPPRPRGQQLVRARSPPRRARLRW